MLSVELSASPSEPTFPPTLAALSRNASVISTSSSSDSLLPYAPRPIRAFSSPRTQSPSAPSPRGSKPPTYLSKQFGLSEAQQQQQQRKDTLTVTQTKAKPRTPSVNSRLTAQDFRFGAIIGEGSYSTVMRATHIATGREYAIKVLDKSHLIRNQKMSTALAEKNALVRLGAGHPGIIRLSWTFHDEWSLYFVLDLVKNGELQSRISKLGSLSTACARYYAAQIVDALDYMHPKGVIHRDLKPENLLLDDAYRIKITDFGTGKILELGMERAKTFVGTPQYMSPELLESSETSKSSDLWALGCILYQMVAGRFAFQGLSEYLTWQKIKQLEYTFPDGFDEQAKDLVQRLLVREPGDRLGAGPPGSGHDMRALRAHPFFASVRWETLWTDAAPPLEAGLVTRVPTPAKGECAWAEIGAAWDELVGDDESVEGDGIEWAGDAEPGPPSLRNGNAVREGAVGQMGQVPNFFSGFQFPKGVGKINGGKHGAGGASEGVQGTVVSEPNKVAIQLRAPSTGSGSSSDGSPIERLGAVLEYMSLKRGRDRTLTPVQGNGLVSEHEWSSFMEPGETVIFKSNVEARSPARRASKLIPIPVPPKKAKARLMVLTTQRLLCMKVQHNGHGITIKAEFSVRQGEKGKDGRCVVVNVEPKGEREFVIMTSSESYHFAAGNACMASTWIKKIHEALQSP